MKDVFTIEDLEYGIDFLFREGQLPSEDIYIHHPKNVAIGGWQRTVDYSRWNTTEGISNKLCALPPRRSSLIDLIKSDRQ